MLELLDLPPELLQRIIKQTIPEGFENFALTCKAVYGASHSLLRQHNLLRCRYRNFSYDRWDRWSPWSYDDGDENNSVSDLFISSSLQLLAKIAEEPLIARYIVVADFKNDFNPSRKEICQAHIKQVKDSPKLLSLLESSPYLQDAGVDAASVLQYMISQYVPNGGDSGLAATFLLTLLPNVTHLAIPKRWKAFGNGATAETGNPCPWKLSSLLDDIIKRANDPKDETASLSKLTSILPSTGWGYERRWGLSTFIPFLSIRSVRKFSAGSCIAVNDDYTGIVFPTPEYENFGVNIEEVELGGACVDGGELGKFLSLLPRLRSLKLSYETKWHGCGHDWNAPATMASIEEAVGNRLENISISIQNCFGEVRRISSMRNFAKLKALEFDINLLLGKNYEEAGDVPRLGDLVPSTIESLQIFAYPTKPHTDALDLLFSNIASDSENKLPSLKKISIRICAWTDGYMLVLQDEKDAARKAVANQTVKRFRIALMALSTKIEVEVMREDAAALSVFDRDFYDRYGLEDY